MENINKKEKKNRRQFSGIVASVGMKDSVIVRVDRVTVHPRYKKRYTVSSRYPSDCKGLDLKVGEAVVIEETRPLSKTKKWRVIPKIESRIKS